MKTNKNFLFAMIAAAAVSTVMTGCKNGDGPDEGLSYITIQAGISSPTDGTTTAFKKDDQVSIYAWTGSNSAVQTPLVVSNSVNTYDGTKWTVNPQMQWKDPTTPHYFVGVHPAKAITDFAADTYGQAIDLLVATALGEGRLATGGTVPLTFDHVMARLDVSLTLHPELGTAPIVESVSTTAQPGAKVNYLTKTVTADGTATSVTLDPQTANKVYTAVLAPQAGITTIVIKIGGKEYTYTHGIDIPIEKGKYTTLNFIVGGTQVELNSVTINDWTTGTPITGGEVTDAPFGDPNFRAVLTAAPHRVPLTNDKIDPADPTTLAALQAITGLHVPNQKITSLKGIEYMTGLTDLYCPENQLTALDVTRNTALTKLNCYNNQLEELDVTRNSALTDLQCGSNQLTALDVTANTALTQLQCSYNQLTALDVTANTALTILNCSTNQLNALDVTANTALTELYCNDNQLTALDVTAHTALTQLACTGNQLTVLDVTANTALTELYCNDNQLTALDVTANTALTKLHCYTNQLSTLDVSRNTALTELYCQGNQLSTLDVTANTALTKLDCGNNLLTALDVSRNNAVTWLYCNNNQLTALDVSQNTALTELYCHSNKLTALDVTANTALTQLFCGAQKDNKTLTLTLTAAQQSGMWQTNIDYNANERVTLNVK